MTAADQSPLSEEIRAVARLNARKVDHARQRVASLADLPYSPRTTAERMIADAELEAAELMSAASQEALAVIEVAENADRSPTLAALSKAVDIYGDHMNDHSADLVESIAMRLAIVEPRLVSVSDSVLGALSHLRSFHGNGVTSWDTFSDMKNAVSRAM